MIFSTFCHRVTLWTALGSLVTCASVGPQMGLGNTKPVSYLCVFTPKPILVSLPP